MATRSQPRVNHRSPPRQGQLPPINWQVAGILMGALVTLLIVWGLVLYTLWRAVH